MLHIARLKLGKNFSQAQYGMGACRYGVLRCSLLARNSSLPQFSMIDSIVNVSQRDRQMR